MKYVNWFIYGLVVPFFGTYIILNVVTGSTNPDNYLLFKSYIFCFLLYHLGGLMYKVGNIDIPNSEKPDKKEKKENLFHIQRPE
jgi:hypothetical protein